MATQINDHNLTNAPDLDDTTAQRQADVPTGKPCAVCDQRGGHLPGCIGVLEGVTLFPADDSADPAYRLARFEP